MEQRRALGRGIASLLPRPSVNAEASVATKAEPAPSPDSPYREVPIKQIRPYPGQPRRYFDEEKIKELGESIRLKGLLHPLVVRQIKDGYELISGERRLRAASHIGLETVPVLIREVAAREHLELALIENLQRTDLDPIEEARSFSELIERFSSTQDEIAKQVGRSRSAIANSLRLLRLPEKLQNALRSGELSLGHAKVLLGEPVDRQLHFFGLIVKEQLTVRDLEAKLKMVGKSDATAQPQAARKKLSEGLLRVLDELRTRLGTKVQIQPGKADAGKIIIDYYSQEQLDELYQRLTGFQITKRKLSRGL